MSQPKLLYRIIAKQASMLAIVAMVGLMTILSSFFLVSDSASSSYALDGTNLQSEVTAEIDGTHYVTLSASDVTFSITPTNGTASDKKQVDVELSTNVSGGASLYLSTSSNKNALYLNGDTNSTSQNIASASSTTTYDNMVNNTWAYSTNDIDFQGVPTIDSPTLLTDIDGVNVGTNTNGVVSATIPIYYAAKVDTSIPSGSYANSVTYLAVVDGGIITNATLTKIEVDGAEVENMQPEVENTLEITTNLMTNTYGTPRVYYETTSPAGYQECGSVTVSRNESGYMTITCKVTPAQAATGVTLHIVPKGSADDRFCTDNTYQPDTSDCEAGEWKWGSLAIEVGDIEEPLQPMQDFTASQCDSMAQGDQIQLMDSRDNKMYWVGKLPDGNCWMTQNLDLDLSTSTTLTPANTNIPSNWTPSTRTSPAIFGYSSDTGKSYNPGDQYYEGTGSEHYHVGNYYQWSAATAGYTGTSQSTQSICPAGWTLPSQSQFQQLIDSGLPNSNFMNAPYYLLRGGYLHDRSLDDAGSGGYYWSSTPDGSSYVYFLFFFSGDIYTTYLYRQYGFPVRCVAAG